MRILFVSAHPQFAGTVCAGTLYKHAQRGDEVYVLSVTAGDLLTDRMPKAEVAKMNKKDMQDAAAILGIKDVRVLGFQDGEVANTLELRTALNAAIRELKPDTVITHWWHNNTLNDCKATGEATTEATFLALMSTGRWAEKYPSHCTLNAFGFEEPMVSVGFEPSAIIDISDCIEVKKKAIGCFRAHCEASFAGDLERFQSALLSPNRYWGLKSGVMYAEPFARIKIHELHNKAIDFLP
jgi:LmbE family N-acetylglucosaminyl deacetylase